MNVKTFGIGCGAVVFALLVFVIYRIANPWETFHFGGYEVQRNRITEMVRLRVGDEWQQSLTDAPYADPLTESDIARVHFANLVFGPHGYFCGVATVSGDKPLNGRLAVLIVVRNRFDGKRRILESERALRCDVEWTPGTPHPFVLNAGMTPPSRVEQFTVTAIPVTAVN